MIFETAENKLLVQKLSEKSIHFSKTVKASYADLWNYISASYPGTQAKEQLWNFVNSNKTIPGCCVCRKPCTFGKYKDGYQKFCSLKCNMSKDSPTRNKLAATMVERHGVTHNSKMDSYLEKRTATLTAKYGVDNPAKIESSKVKSNATRLERYGTANRFTHIMRKKYGVDNCMHLTEFHDKASRHRSKELALPSGKTVMYQGYEHFAISDLLKQHDESDLRIHHEVPKILYAENKIHFPDIFIPKDNLVIEVKSSYTFTADLDKNLAKMMAAIEQGFNYEIWIYDRNGALIEKHVNQHQACAIAK